MGDINLLISLQVAYLLYFMLQYSCIPGQSRLRAELFQGGGEDLGTGMPPVPRAGHGMKEWTHKTVIAVWQLRSFLRPDTKRRETQHDRHRKRI